MNCSIPEELSNYFKKTSASKENYVNRDEFEEFFIGIAARLGVQLKRQYKEKNLSELPQYKIPLTNILDDLRSQRYEDIS